MKFKFDKDESTITDIMSGKFDIVTPAIVTANI